MGTKKQEAFRTVRFFFSFQKWPSCDRSNDVLRYSPANYVNKWSTPQLLIHGSKDYRLPETESIGAYHALKQFVWPFHVMIT